MKLQTNLGWKGPEEAIWYDSRLKVELAFTLGPVSLGLIVQNFEHLQDDVYVEGKCYFLFWI